MSRARWATKHKGTQMRSGFEARTAKFLDSKKVVYEYEEHKIKYSVPEAHRTYCPDFKLPNGIFLECKGNFPAADRKKMLLVIEQNPELDIRLVFMRDNKISKASKTTYTMWAKKHGIECHVDTDGKLPKEWLVNKIDNEDNTL